MPSGDRCRFAVPDEGSLDLMCTAQRPGTGLGGDNVGLAGSGHQRASGGGVAAVAVFVLLLALPFTGRFASMTTSQKDLYLVAVVAAASAVGCLLAPASRALIMPVGTPVRRSRLITRAGAVLLVAAATVELYLVIALVGT
jgi:hypothetical protein